MLKLCKIALKICKNTSFCPIIAICISTLKVPHHFIKCEVYIPVLRAELKLKNKIYAFKTLVYTSQWNGGAHTLTYWPSHLTLWGSYNILVHTLRCPKFRGDFGLKEFSPMGILSLNIVIGDLFQTCWGHRARHYIRQKRACLCY